MYTNLLKRWGGREKIGKNYLKTKIYNKKETKKKLTGYFFSIVRSHLRTKHINMCRTTKEKRWGTKKKQKNKLQYYQRMSKVYHS